MMVWDRATRLASNHEMRSGRPHAGRGAADPSALSNRDVDGGVRTAGDMTWASELEGAGVKKCTTAARWNEKVPSAIEAAAIEPLTTPKPPNTCQGA